MEAMEAIAPCALALPGDPVGLQVGDPDAPLNGVVVALDPGNVAVERAISIGANAVVAHHPLIYRPLDRIVSSEVPAKLLLEMIRAGIALYVAHTNLDRASGGVNDVLAETIGLTTARPLHLGDGCPQYKLIVFVPKGHEERVREAACSAGAGVIGEYTFCTFQTEGVGTFTPGGAAQPFSGEMGQLNRADELRLEMVVSEPHAQRVLDAVKQAHPYEEVAYDLLVTAQKDERFALGRIGELDEPVLFEQFVSRVREALKLDAVRIAGDREKEVRRVATIAGSGGKFVSAAAAAGADALVTGDVGYHDAREACVRGLCIVDAGHDGTERVVIEPLAEMLRQRLGKLDKKLKVETVHEPAVFTGL
jgi:dinuclear metal center YbgI/SA1388 family protein